MTTPFAADSAAFEALLADMYGRWTAFLARSHRSLRSHHPDLVQQAAIDLTNYARAHAREEVQDWVALGFRILHRRIADHYRSDARKWASEPIRDELPEPNPSTNPERVAIYAAELQRVVAFLAGLEDQDRHLLLVGILEDGAQEDDPRPATERKRLSRLRARLREHLGNPRNEPGTGEE